MVLRVYFLIIIHDKKRTPNIRQLESSIAISASCNLNPSHLKNICKKWWYDVHRWYSPTLSDYIVWEVSRLQNKKLSLVRYATVDEHIIMHWLRSSIIQSMGANHKTSPHLTSHPLANLLAALSSVWKCPPFQACTNSSYWRFPQISHLTKKHLPNLVAGVIQHFCVKHPKKVTVTA